MSSGLERLSRNPTVVAAVVAALASFVGNRIASNSADNQSRISEQSTEDQLEANLILQAVKVCDKKQARENLDFLLAADFLPNHADKLRQALTNNLQKFTQSQDCPKVAN